MHQLGDLVLSYNFDTSKLYGIIIKIENNLYSVMWFVDSTESFILDSYTERNIDSLKQNLIEYLNRDKI